MDGTSATDGAILVLNAGSSSIKFAVFNTRGEELPAGPHGQIEGIGAAPRLRAAGLADGSRISQEFSAADIPHHRAAYQCLHDWLVAHHAGAREVIAIGHRVVHGGMAYSHPVRIDSKVLAGLDTLVPLAPLHQPHALAAIRAVTAVAETPQYACFDTAFHRTQPPIAQVFALPRALTEAGIRRYGFHGLSYEYIASVLPPEIAAGRVVVAHLGAGSSMCAMQAGRSVASTMGFTALDGLPMSTRSGALDPGAVLYLLQQYGMTAAEVSDLLYNRSGLLGVSGVSGDMRDLLASDTAGAREAVDLYCYRIARELGSLAAALGGLDGLVFTAGIGENAGAIRARVVAASAWLGFALDPAANAAGAGRISPPERSPSVWVIPTDENLMIARHVRALHR